MAKWFKGCAVLFTWENTVVKLLIFIKITNVQNNKCQLIYSKAAKHRTVHHIRFIVAWLQQHLGFIVNNAPFSEAMNACLIISFRMPFFNNPL